MFAKFVKCMNSAQHKNGRSTSEIVGEDDHNGDCAWDPHEECGAPWPPKRKKHPVDVGSQQEEDILTQVQRSPPSPPVIDRGVSLRSTRVKSPGGSGSLNMKPLLPALPLAVEGSKCKRCLVLDLDECLVHAEREKPGCYDFDIDVHIGPRTFQVYVTKRPGLELFLENASKHFELILFSASMKEYCEAVLKSIDPHKLVSYCLSRKECTEYEGLYVKDLSRLGRPLRDVILLDDNPKAYLFQPENALPINSWYDDMEDTDLESVSTILAVVTKSSRSAVTTLAELDKRLGWNREGGLVASH